MKFYLYGLLFSSIILTSGFLAFADGTECSNANGNLKYVENIPRYGNAPGGHARMVRTATWTDGINDLGEKGYVFDTTTTVVLENSGNQRSGSSTYAIRVTENNASTERKPFVTYVICKGNFSRPE